MALTSLLARTPDAGTLVVRDRAAGRRFDVGIEAAAYFCVAEAVQELAGPVAVVLDAPDGAMLLVITGPDSGAVPLARMRDRVEAAGGSVSVARSDGRAVLEVRAASAAAVA
ncbi:hypothetical protein [Georgenia muralis]|nr:hypothetical protein [Georgenia muralis]